MIGVFVQKMWDTLLSGSFHQFSCEKWGFQVWYLGVVFLVFTLILPLQCRVITCNWLHMTTLFWPSAPKKFFWGFAGRKSERIATPAWKKIGSSAQLAHWLIWVIFYKCWFQQGFSCAQFLRNPSNIIKYLHIIYIPFNPIVPPLYPSLYTHGSRSPWTPTLHLSVEWTTQNEWFLTLVQDGAHQICERWFTKHDITPSS